MTRVIGILALGIAAGMAGCQSTGMGRDMNMSKNETISPSDGLPASEVAGASDQAFVNDAAAGGMYEVEAGRLAVSKGFASKVQMIGLHMVADHMRLGDELAGIVKQEKMTAAGEPTGEQKGMIEKLNSLAGADFDKEYLKQQEAAHRETIAKFEAEAQGGGDKAVRAFAARSLPTLREHLRMISGEDEGVRLGSER